MKIALLFFGIASTACVFSGSNLLAQANVSENESVTLYVNASTGSDRNTGTSEKPFKTIQAAVNSAAGVNALGEGVLISVADGVYRESVTIRSHTSSAPMTLQAESTGGAIIDGADVLTGNVSDSGGVYQYAWTDKVTGCALPSGWYSGMPPVVLANEMFFVNGTQLAQVMNASTLQAGTFYVNHAENSVSIDPPAGTDMSTAVVEGSDRRSTLLANNTSNLVVRGLVFEHAASCMNQTGATVSGGSNILFDSVQANWNNWGALGINMARYVTVENSVSSFNGGSGLSGYEDVSSLWQNNETDYNNWRGAMVGLYDFAQGGLKLMRAHQATVSGHQAYNNPSQGLWFDTDNMDVSIENAKLVGNSVANLQLEASQGPITVTGSALCSGGGLQLINTAGLTLTGDTFYNNGGNSFQNGQLFLAGNPGGRIVSNWQTGSSSNVYTSGAEIQGNTFISSGSSQYGFNTYLSGNDWSEYINSVDSNENNWYDASNLNAFGIPSGKHVSLSQWQKSYGQDTHSTWGSVDLDSSTCSVPTPSYADFQILAHNAASYVASYSMSKGVVSIPLQIRSFGYGTVRLSVSGLPDGVSGAFADNSLVSGSSKLTLTATADAPKATVPITIFAASGSHVHTLTVWVNIGPA